MKQDKIELKPKKRTLNELRQTKDAAYKAPYKLDDDGGYLLTFSRKGLKKLLEDFNSSDETVGQFVNSII
jgi:hypothetical protein